MRASLLQTATPWRRLSIVLALALAVGLSSCGEDGEEKDAGVSLPDDTSGPNFNKDAEDTSDEPDVEVDIAPDVVETPDVPTSDTGPSCTTFGCPCSQNSDCEAGHCIDSPGGQICTKSCTENCPDGYKCVTAGGVDGASICVPQFGNICAPCKNNAICQTTGHKGAKCVDRGAIGAFCGTTCLEQSDCPANYKCDKEAVDVTGETVAQCVLTVGSCACSKVALEQEWSTTCTKTIGDAVCQGERICLAKGKEGAPPNGGLTGCIAKEPEPESCDGKDNDCDAETDETTCEDDNDCTLNDCGGDAGCLNSNKTGPCDDNSMCTEGDVCTDGSCTPGKAKDCDDQNPCTTDVCKADKGCLYEAADNVPCNADDNPCTVNDSCTLDKGSGKSVCTSGKQKACDSGGACSTGVCLSSTGKCKYTAKDGFPCDDGDPCSVETKCNGEVCQGKPNKCDDSDPCTTDTCDPKTGCTHGSVADAQSCDDGNPCTTSSICISGKCTGGEANKCDDANDCTKDTCDPKSGCKNESLNATPCEDGDPCSGPDACDSGFCKAGGDLCVCKVNDDCKKLEDGDLCNGTLICKQVGGASKCVVDEATLVKCDDGNMCTGNSCDKQTGKCSTKNLAISCDDKNVCTQGDKCGADPKTGKYACVPGAAKDCDDKVACTVDTCDAGKGCQNVSAQGKDVPCYAGPAGTAGVGKCKAGLQTCKPDGTLTACIGEVKPEPKEVCGNKIDGKLVDDDCDGKVDPACGPTLVFGHAASGAISGKVGNLVMRGSVGASAAAGPAAQAGAQNKMESGFYAWLAGFF